MSRLEALRTELDSVRVDNQHLEAENACLREETGGNEKDGELAVQATELEVERDSLAEECKKLKALYEGVLQTLQEVQVEQEKTAEESRGLRHTITALETEQQEARHRLQQREQEVTELHTEIERLAERMELERLRAAAEEKTKWEAKEERLITLLQQLQRQLSGPKPTVVTTGRTVCFTSGPVTSVDTIADETSPVETTDAATPMASAETRTPITANEDAGTLSPIAVEGGAGSGWGEGRSGSEGWPESNLKGGGGTTEGDGDPRSGGRIPYSVMNIESVPEERVIPSFPSPTSLPLLAQQLPPLSKFTGDTIDGGETIAEWLEQLELVASACRWDEPTKLVNLVTRLKGPAFSFYRSCDLKRRNHYSTLAEELKKRFTPVRIQAVQSSLFHDRKQKSGESVDAYAQELKYLFRKAYPLAQQASIETQDMGRSVLTNQFVSGLQSDMKSKLAGKEGGFEQLLTLARFEEAKIRDLRSSSGTPGMGKRSKDSSTRTPARMSDSTLTTAGQGSPNFRCYECGKRGHRARECPDRKRRDKEAPGKGEEKRTPDNKWKQVSAITPDGGMRLDEDWDQRVEELRRQLQEAEMESALRKKTVTMHGVESDPPNFTSINLGPTVHTEVEIEGCCVKALGDTGSPATVVSLDCVLSVLAKGRHDNQTPEEWEDAVRRRLKPPEITLRSYGGGRLNIVVQLSVTIRSGAHSKTAVVMVQSQASVDLLLGTDLQPYLGFHLLHNTGQGTIELLPLPESEQRNGAPTLERHQQPSPATVRLLQATRLPAHHARIVRARIDILPCEGTRMFVPAHDSLRELGLGAEEGLVEVEDDHTLFLVLRNPSDVMIRLQEGVLGELQPVENLLPCWAQMNLQGPSWVSCPPRRKVEPDESSNCMEF